MSNEIPDSGHATPQRVRLNQGQSLDGLRTDKLLTIPYQLDASGITTRISEVGSHSSVRNAEGLRPASFAPTWRSL
jgi:hypothetical protein